MPEESDQRTATGRSPGAGCVIMIVALLSLAFLVSFAVWNLFKLDKELAKFTDDEPKPTPLPDLVENAAAVNTLNSKIEVFKDDEGNGRPGNLTVTAEEINLAVAIFDEFEELRETFHVEEIKDGRLHIAISYKMNGRPLSGEFRYLNGTMVAKPILSEGEIYLDVEEVNVPDKEVADGFLGMFSPLRITEQYLEDETLGPWMKKLTDLEVDGKTIALSIDPAETPPSGEPVKLTKTHIIRAAILFGVILTGFFLLFSVARKKGLQKPE